MYIHIEANNLATLTMWQMDFIELHYDLHLIWSR